VLEITILGSGSAGNSALVRAGDTVILIDAGLSARRLRERILAAGSNPDGLAGILLTHEHGDHTAALRVLCSGRSTPIYCNAATAHCLRDGALREHPAWRLFETGSTFPIGPLTIRSFAVPHDAAEPVGYTIRNGGASLGILTDLGHPTTLATEAVRGVHTLLIETNYDEGLLQRDTKRPWGVKQRILSRHGHLSNHDAAGLVESIAPHGLRRIVMGHLSRDCNDGALAAQTLRDRLGDHPVEIYCASQDEVSPRFAVG